MTVYEQIKAARSKHGRDVVFEATHIDTGIRACYKVGEHLNVGEGYIMSTHPYKWGDRAVPSIKLKDVVVLEPEA